jgi:uncharacterized protein (DUF736 family)
MQPVLVAHVDWRVTGGGNFVGNSFTRCKETAARDFLNVVIAQPTIVLHFHICILYKIYVFVSLSY